MSECFPQEYETPTNMTLQIPCTGMVLTTFHIFRRLDSLHVDCIAATTLQGLVDEAGGVSPLYSVCNVTSHYNIMQAPPRSAQPSACMDI